MTIAEIDKIPRHRPGRPQVRPDEVTLRLILDAAAERFRTDGFAGTAMSTVAQHAGISTKTLYRLVPTKAELFRRVIGARIGRFILEVGDVDGRSHDLAADLERLLAAYARLVLEPETLAIYRLAVAESGRFPELGQTFYENALKPTGEVLARWLEARCRSGQINLDDPRMAADMLRGMMVMEPQRIVMFGVAGPPDAARITERARDCARLFLQGCVASSDASEPAR